ncbi:hypothetical protein I4U23_007139 [Adineta vaga]|nr:hypothetical protein I4U23_007139 [Adineta vaga]
MASQPWNEENNNDNNDINLKSAQDLHSITQHLKSGFSFSKITDICDERSVVSSLPFYNEESNCSEESIIIPYDVESKVNEMLDDDKFAFENPSCDMSNEWIVEELDKLDVQKLDRSVQDRIMSVEIQPPTDIRRRYQSDGKRHIEKSRSKPMSIKLPNLRNCQMNLNQSFWLQLILITSNNNPTGKAYIHIDKLEYHADDLPECDHGFVRIPLAPADIQAGYKQLARISIIKSKLDAYKFELKPYDPLSTSNQSEAFLLDENKNAKGIVAKAKAFRDIYHLKSSRIACQLLIKQGNTWYPTNIACETNLMDEKENQTSPKTSLKRSVTTDNFDDTDEEYERPRQKSTKKIKKSSSLSTSLPIIRTQSK